MRGGLQRKYKSGGCADSVRTYGMKTGHSTTATVITEDGEKKVTELKGTAVLRRPKYFQDQTDKQNRLIPRIIRSIKSKLGIGGSK